MIGLSSYLQGRQRQKGVVSVPEKWIQLVGGQGDSVLSTEGALSGATAVKLPSWSQSLEKQAPQSPGRLSNLCSQWAVRPHFTVVTINWLSY